VCREGAISIKKSYWLAHRLLESNAIAVYGDLYRLTLEMNNFDVVLIGCILLHLANPRRVVHDLAERTNQTIVITDVLPKPPRKSQCSVAMELRPGR